MLKYEQRLHDSSNMGDIKKNWKTKWPTVRNSFFTTGWRTR